MPTLKQKLAINNLVDFGGNVSRAMVLAGYSPATAHSPQKLTESKGFQNLCADFGLTREFLVRTLVEDIKAKPQKRKPELELACKILGLSIERTGTAGFQNNVVLVVHK